MISAGVAAVFEGRNGQAPFVGFKNAAGGHEAHEPQEKALAFLPVTDEKPGGWRENAEQRQEDQRFDDIERLHKGLHFSMCVCLETIGQSCVVIRANAEGAKGAFLMPRG